MNPKKHQHVGMTFCSPSEAIEFHIRFIRQILEDHSGRPELGKLSALMRAGNLAAAYSEADFLSEQKYPDAASHFAANQLALLIKKFPWDPATVGLDPRAAAIRTFYDGENRCRRMNRKLKLLMSLPHSRDMFANEARVARTWIRSVIGPTPSYRATFERADFGPGASIGTHGDATSYAVKSLAARWTVSPGALHHAYACIRKNYHLWCTLLEKRGNIVCYDEEAAFKAYLRRIDVVEYNKISFVPKTAKTHRTIAVGPLLNGLCQKGVDEVLRTFLLKAGLDLRDQSINQELARLGSLSDDEDSFVTIDLRNASNSLAIELTRYLLPYGWTRCLDRLREPMYMLDNAVKRYNMYVSMGNGFCFPLQTLIFSAACYAVSGVPPQDMWNVYGDDIVIRKKWAEPVLKLLKHWGFKANLSKTFLNGPFRESCGTDWYHGQNVRPVTLDALWDNPAEVFKFLNQTGMPGVRKDFFASVRDMAIRRIPEQFRFFRPYKGEENTAITSTGDEHLSCPFVKRKQHRWVWKELRARPLIDLETMRALSPEVAMSDALRGATALRVGPLTGYPKVIYRRRAVTKVARESYEATSNWLPPKSA